MKGALLRLLSVLPRVVLAPFVVIGLLWIAEGDDPWPGYFGCALLGLAICGVIVSLPLILLGLGVRWVWRGAV